jgi:hypothetical protein
MITSIVEELVGRLKSLERSLSGLPEFESLLFRYGWIPAIGTEEFQPIRQAFNFVDEIQDFIDQLNDLVADENFEDSFFNEGVGNANPLELLSTVREGITLVKDIAKIDESAIQNLTSPFDQSSFWQEISERILEDVFVSTLTACSPKGFAFLHLFGVIEFKEEHPEGELRITYLRTFIHWGKLVDLFSSPGELFRDVYFWNKPDEAFRWQKLLHAIERGFLANQQLVRYTAPRQSIVESYSDPEYAQANSTQELTLPLIYGTSMIEETFYNVGLGLMPIGRDDPSIAPDGLLITPILEGELSNDFFLTPDISINFDALNADTAFGIKLYPDDVVFDTDVGNSDISTTVGLKGESFSPWILVGSRNSHRLEMNGFELDFSVSGTLDDPEVKISFKTIADEPSTDVPITAGMKLVVQMEESDDFLKENVSSNQLEALFDVDLEWSSKNGFSLNGSADISLNLPLSQHIGPIEIRNLSVNIAAESSTQSQNLVKFRAGLGIKGEFGPVEFYIGDIGLSMDLTAYSHEELRSLPVDAAPPLLGMLDFDLNFAPPKEIGLSINTEGVVGGGFLKIDPPHYAGILQLDVKDKFSIMAIGVLTTELPDGQPGFSMLFQIVAEFSPIQLGLGFALTGVGGMVGINRQFHEENMRRAIKNHEFDLFPTEEPDFFTIINTYQSVLPPMKGHHIFGPIVKIHWGGTVKLVEFEVGIFLQLGGPVQVLIVGRAWSVLPDEDTKILVLDFDVFGIIDFGDGRLEIEATLSPGSKFMGYDLDGQMALKADWKGAGKTFVMSVGGFHPEFQQIPIGFPTLRRLQILARKSGADITLQLYFAVTTNSLQFGALLDISAKKSGFKIIGGGGFDALIIFNPFSFTVLIYFGVRVSKGWFSAGLDLELELSGPNPLQAKGYVKFSYGFGSKKIRFSKKFGEEKNQQLPNSSPVAALLSELSNVEHLKFEIPSWARAGVIYREGAESMADPLADIIISQEAVPLKVTIDKFGGSRLQASERKLDIEADVAADIVEEVETLFAPAQFIDMTVDQKLSSPAFTNYKSGVRLKSSYVIPQTSETRELVFETVLRESRFYPQATTSDNTHVNKAAFICLWAPDFEKKVSRVANWSLAGAGLIHAHRKGNVFEAEDEIGAIGFDDSEITILDNTAIRLEELEAFSSNFSVEEEVTVNF